MNADHYENVALLRGLLLRLARSDWRKLTKWSIKASEVRLLLVLKENSLLGESQRMTVSDISKILQVTSPTVTQMINNLIKNDYVIRTTHPTDRRIAEITLSQKGDKIAQEASEMFTKMFEGLIDFLGKEQSDQLIHLMDQSIVYFEQVDIEKL
ncbi:MarR family transcriptional regulator [Paenibacillus alba]|uniref:MarR family winged helix-turn-helix transcriptional regulator n=1 Tax=Paenibacillus alba TaxID=1197127 RepID=UPI001563FDE3|nr:MarR family transcriptional regulator [Paenibacillus alba]NQX68940.1 MarR family transcriptional regulator [Paenibacillus alba]